MTIHLSARLTWHDTGWDGRICAHPLANVFCLVHDHIRDSRDDALEVANKGRELADIGYRPPCARDPGVYSLRSFELEHRDPLSRQGLGPVTEEIPAFSVSTSPYGHMLKAEGGWEMDPERQLETLHSFFSQLEPQRSLVFFYLKDGQPFTESSRRIIAGVGRIAKVGQQLFFAGSDKQGRRYPVWARAITQKYPGEGVRLPLQEYHGRGLDPDPILCYVPENLTSSFSYVAEHVSDDTAVSVIEHVMESLVAVQREGHVQGPWERHIAWLDGTLAEVWRERGPFPGVGVMLQYLGCRSGVMFQRKVVGPLSRKGQDPWGLLEPLLEGRRTPEWPGHTKGLLDASARWRSESAARRDLLRALTRFDLTPAQFERVAHPTKRADAGMAFPEEELVSNPYLLVENDLGTADSKPIGIEAIDNGMLSAIGLPEQPTTSLHLDDPRRVRSLLWRSLVQAAAEGDTLLPLEEASRRCEKSTARDRRCLPDPGQLEAHRGYMEELLAFIDVPQGRVVQLRALHEDEELVRARLQRLVSKEYDVPTLDWDPILQTILKEARSLPSADEERARLEKAEALQRALGFRLAVIAGRAGTGKTTVARALLEGIQRVDGRSSVLLLAPTGKARVRLQEITKQEAKTIHQFLAELNWINFESMTLRRSGGQQAGAATILVDESSMMPIDLLAALFRAIRFNEVRRFIFLGDPNQLPPIGPGRPFADLIGWLEADEQRQRRLVQLWHRGRFLDLNSLGLQLSDGYTSGSVPPGDDEVLARMARGDVAQTDVEVHFWKDPDDLARTLREHVARTALAGAAPGDYRALDASFQDGDGRGSPEAWQILSPVRRQTYGTDEINRSIQLDYRRELIEMSKERRTVGGVRLPRPAGDQQIVRHDKVIQTVNERRQAWREADRSNDRHYVANGEVGIITWAETLRQGGERFNVVFGTQPGLRFSYWRSQVDESLELAYAITVHKSQGGDFGLVFLVLPQSAATLSRELLYTALTRFRRKLVLLIEKDVRMLETYRRPDRSETVARNTNLFSLGMRPETIGFPHPERLIHRTIKGTLVRSKSEVVVADALTSLDIDYKYEEPLYACEDPRDFRLPDFTVQYEGETWYWEHLGMLSVPSYRDQWERKQKWYQDNGYAQRLITSEDGPDGSIDASAIAKVARERILA